MNILADESVDQPIVKRLRVDGHNVLYISEMKRGLSDEEVLASANQNKMLLLTLDKDFGELVFRKKLINSGVLLVRLPGLPNEEKTRIVSFAIKNYNNKLLQSFSVLTSKSIRIRNADFK